MTQYKGQLKGFPTEVVEWMLDQQERQGNKRDVSIFEHDREAYAKIGGFVWGKTEEDSDNGFNFCKKVIKHMDFDLFFERYPSKS